MLKNLYIENIAVIEKTTIDFSNGLNVLTGETGAANRPPIMFLFFMLKYNIIV